MEPAGNERDPIEARLDVFVHPAFRSAARTLLEAAVDEARRRGWRWLTAQVTAVDADKTGILEAAGFREVATLPAAVRFGGREHDARLLRTGGGMKDARAVLPGHRVLRARWRRSPQRRALG